MRIEEVVILARKRKKLWNMMVVVIPIVIGGLGTVSKELENGLVELETRGRIEIIQNRAL